MGKKIMTTIAIDKIQLNIAKRMVSTKLYVLER